MKNINKLIPIKRNAAEGLNMSVKYPIIGANIAYVILFDILCTDNTVAL